MRNVYTKRVEKIKTKYVLNIFRKIVTFMR